MTRPNTPEDNKSLGQFWPTTVAALFGRSEVLKRGGSYAVVGASRPARPHLGHLRDSWRFSLSSAPTVVNPCRPLQPESE